jgi:hypothetical protein
VRLGALMLGVLLALSGTFRLALQIFDDGDKRDLFRSTPARHLLEEYLELVDGSSDGAVNVCYSDTGTVLASGTNGITLCDNLDPYGRSNVFTSVKLLALRNNSVDSDDVLWMGPDATAPWVGFWGAAAHRSVCNPGTTTPRHPGLVILYDPRGIGDIESGVTDTFNIEEKGGSNDVSYSIIVAGVGLAA